MLACNDNAPERENLKVASSPGKSEALLSDDFCRGDRPVALNFRLVGA
jgi:hypothetical protein